MVVTMLTVFVYVDQVLDISSPVKVTASSSILISGTRFTSFIQADTSYVWANCFTSKLEANPWFRLELKSVTSIFNVQLEVRAQSGEELPADYNPTGMANLSVYVSNSGTNRMEKNTLCGNPWAYQNTKMINLNCTRNLRGNFVHVIVPSSSPTYLAICSIVLNRDDGTVNNTNTNRGNSASKVSVGAEACC